MAWTCRVIKATVIGPRCHQPSAAAATSAARAQTAALVEDFMALS
jgi:hypothetical protein